MTASAETRAVHGFVGTYGYAPSGVWSAPGRVNLVGEHTDYNGGLSLPLAGPWRTYAAVAARRDRVLRAESESVPGGTVTVSLDDVGPRRPHGWAAYVAGVLWALRDAGYTVPGADVFVASDVPVGAGLSSSAALECATAAAVSDLAGEGLLGDEPGRTELARACRRAENVVVGVPTGDLDQLASLLGRAGHALLVDSGRGRTSHVPLDLGPPGLDLLVVDTGAPHALVDGQYAQRQRTCERAARLLGVRTLREVTTATLPQALDTLPDEETRARVRHVVTENERVERCVEALTGGDYSRVGQLLLTSHASLRDDYAVSSPPLDAVVEAAVGARALGARLTGGGFGGCAIVLVPQSAAAAVEADVAAAFTAAGWPPPPIRRAWACPGADRVR